MYHEIQMADNRDIDGFLLSSDCWEIHLGFGISELYRYWEDCRLRSEGFSYDELGIAKRRHEQRPIIIDSDAHFVEGATIYQQSETPLNSIALLKLSGVMRSQDGISTRGMDSMIGDLRAAYSNSNIKGVIIETNSGGGESLAGTMLKSAISERNKPVVGFGHMVASAAYRALSGADEIGLSGNGSESGSIGTMISMDRKTLEDYKARYMDFYGATAPEKNSEYRSAVQGIFEGLQARVNEKTVQFQNEIRDERNLRGGTAKVAETLNGAMYAAEQSKIRGLSDWTGNMNYAIKRVNALRAKY